jgi:hypothetical protein
LLLLLVNLDNTRPILICSQLPKLKALPEARQELFHHFAKTEAVKAPFAPVEEARSAHPFAAAVVAAQSEEPKASASTAAKTALQKISKFVDWFLFLTNDTFQARV